MLHPQLSVAAQTTLPIWADNTFLFYPSVFYHLRPCTQGRGGFWSLSQLSKSLVQISLMSMFSCSCDQFGLLVIYCFKTVSNCINDVRILEQQDPECSSGCILNILT